MKIEDTDSRCTGLGVLVVLQDCFVGCEGSSGREKVYH